MLVKQMLEIATTLEREAQTTLQTARNLRRLAETRQENRLTPEGRARIARAARIKARKMPPRHDPVNGRFLGLAHRRAA